jgi:hypothetical protein
VCRRHCSVVADGNVIPLQIAFEGILEIGHLVALGDPIPPDSDVCRHDGERWQLKGETVLGDRLAAFPIRPWAPFDLYPGHGGRKTTPGLSALEWAACSLPGRRDNRNDFQPSGLLCRGEFNSPPCTQLALFRIAPTGAFFTWRRP